MDTMKSTSKKLNASRGSPRTNGVTAPSTRPVRTQANPKDVAELWSRKVAASLLTGVGLMGSSESAKAAPGYSITEQQNREEMQMKDIIKRRTQTELPSLQAPPVMVSTAPAAPALSSVEAADNEKLRAKLTVAGMKLKNMQSQVDQGGDLLNQLRSEKEALLKELRLQKEELLQELRSVQDIKAMALSAPVAAPAPALAMAAATATPTAAAPPPPMAPVSPSPAMAAAPPAVAKPPPAPVVAAADLTGLEDGVGLPNATGVLFGAGMGAFALFQSRKTSTLEHRLASDKQILATLSAKNDTMRPKIEAEQRRTAQLAASIDAERAVVRKLREDLQKAFDSGDLVAATQLKRKEVMAVLQSTEEVEARALLLEEKMNYLKADQSLTVEQEALVMAGGAVAEAAATETSPASRAAMSLRSDRASNVADRAAMALKADRAALALEPEHIDADGPGDGGWTEEKSARERARLAFEEYEQAKNELEVERMRASKAEQEARFLQTQLDRSENLIRDELQTLKNAAAAAKNSIKGSADLYTLVDQLKKQLEEQKFDAAKKLLNAGARLRTDAAIRIDEMMQELFQEKDRADSATEVASAANAKVQNLERSLVELKFQFDKHSLNAGARLRLEAARVTDVWGQLVQQKNHADQLTREQRVLQAKVEIGEKAAEHVTELQKQMADQKFVLDKTTLNAGAQLRLKASQVTDIWQQLEAQKEWAKIAAREGAVLRAEAEAAAKAAAEVAPLKKQMGDQKFELDRLSLNAGAKLRLQAARVSDIWEQLEAQKERAKQAAREGAALRDKVEEGAKAAAKVVELEKAMAVQKFELDKTQLKAGARTRLDTARFGQLNEQLDYQRDQLNQLAREAAVLRALVEEGTRAAAQVLELEKAMKQQQFELDKLTLKSGAQTRLDSARFAELREQLDTQREAAKVAARERSLLREQVEEGVKAAANLGQLKKEMSEMKFQGDKALLNATARMRLEAARTQEVKGQLQMQKEAAVQASLDAKERLAAAKREGDAQVAALEKKMAEERWMADKAALKAGALQRLEAARSDVAIKELKEQKEVAILGSKAEIAELKKEMVDRKFQTDYYSLNAGARIRLQADQVKQLQDQVAQQKVAARQANLSAREREAKATAELEAKAKKQIQELKHEAACYSLNAGARIRLQHAQIAQFTEQLQQKDGQLRQASLNAREREAQATAAAEAKAAVEAAKLQQQLAQQKFEADKISLNSGARIRLGAALVDQVKDQLQEQKEVTAQARAHGKELEAAAKREAAAQVAAVEKLRQEEKFIADKAALKSGAKARLDTARVEVFIQQLQEQKDIAILGRKTETAELKKQMADMKFQSDYYTLNAGARIRLQADQVLVLKDQIQEQKVSARQAMLAAREREAQATAAIEAKAKKEFQELKFESDRYSLNAGARIRLQADQVVVLKDQMQDQKLASRQALLSARERGEQATAAVEFKAQKEILALKYESDRYMLNAGARIRLHSDQIKQLEGLLQEQKLAARQASLNAREREAGAVAQAETQAALEAAKLAKQVAEEKFAADKLALNSGARIRLGSALVEQVKGQLQEQKEVTKEIRASRDAERQAKVDAASQVVDLKQNLQKVQEAKFHSDKSALNNGARMRLEAARVEQVKEQLEVQKQRTVDVARNGELKIQTEAAKNDKVMAQVKYDSAYASLNAGARIRLQASQVAQLKEQIEQQKELAVQARRNADLRVQEEADSAAKRMQQELKKIEAQQFEAAKAALKSQARMRTEAAIQMNTVQTQMYEAAARADRAEREVAEMIASSPIVAAQEAKAAAEAAVKAKAAAEAQVLELQELLTQRSAAIDETDDLTLLDAEFQKFKSDTEAQMNELLAKLQQQTERAELAEQEAQRLKSSSAASSVSVLAAELGSAAAKIAEMEEELRRLQAELSKRDATPSASDSELAAELATAAVRIAEMEEELKKKEYTTSSVSDSELAAELAAAVTKMAVMEDKLKKKDARLRMANKQAKDALAAEAELEQLALQTEKELARALAVNKELSRKSGSTSNLDQVVVLA